MLSWYRVECLMVFLGLPLCLMLLPGLIPSLAIQDMWFGGGPVREWVLNHTLVPLLDRDGQAMLFNLWQNANVLTESAIYLLVVLNLYALLLPFLYGLGELVMKLINALSTASFLNARQQLKKSGVNHG